MTSLTPELTTDPASPFPAPVRPATRTRRRRRPVPEDRAGLRLTTSPEAADAYRVGIDSKVEASRRGGGARSPGPDRVDAAAVPVAAVPVAAVRGR